MADTHTDSNGVTFNDRVEATAAYGTLAAKVENIERRVEKIDDRTEKMWATQQRFLGVVAIGSVLLPILTTIAARVLWP